MAEKIQKHIIDYFSFFEEFYITSKTCLKDCQDCAVSINKLIKRCKNIKQAEVSGSPLEEFVDLQSKLSSILHNLIEEDIQEIKSKLSTVEDLFEKLLNKHQVLLESCKQTDLEPTSLLVKGTPFQPPLKQLLEFAEDTISFASQVQAQIETSLSILSFKGLNTEPLLDNFKISTNWQRRIPEILAYTSFCPENQI
ncbi:uncharacterized protein ACR2FA_010198 [Aphomia sociella]